jgi:hypothetical protein
MRLFNELVKCILYKITSSINSLTEHVPSKYHQSDAKHFAQIIFHSSQQDWKSASLRTLISLDSAI